MRKSSVDVAMGLLREDVVTEKPANGPKVPDKELRRRKRATARPLLLAEEGKTVLQTHAVGKANQKRYQLAVERFSSWNMTPLPTWSRDQMDLLLVNFLDDMFWEGEQLAQGTAMLAAVQHKWPELGRGERTSFPRSRQALQGWRRLGPARARLPFPWLVAAGAAHWMAEQSLAEMALTTVLAFICYLRPGVAAALVVEQFTPPVATLTVGGKRGPEHVWCVNLHPQEWETSSKTGTWDETVEITDIEQWAWVELALAARMAKSRVGLHAWGRRTTATLDGVAQGEPLMAETHAQWAATLREALRCLGVPAKSDPHLYRLRNGGAPHDVAYKLRSLDQVQKRGSWRSTASVARYAKPARLNEQIQAMPATVVADLRRRESQLPQLLLKRLSEKH